MGTGNQSIEGDLARAGGFIGWYGFRAEVRLFCLDLEPWWSERMSAVVWKDVASQVDHAVAIYEPQEFAHVLLEAQVLDQPGVSGFES